MRLFQRPFFVWLLCFFVLCLQQDAPLHALGHALEDIAAASALHKGAPPASHSACPECLALSPAGAALTSSAWIAPLAEFSQAFFTTLRDSQGWRHALAYRAQAPPALPLHAFA